VLTCLLWIFFSMKTVKRTEIRLIGGLGELERACRACGVRAAFVRAGRSCVGT
jgi:hypothetical protein